MLNAVWTAQGADMIVNNEQDVTKAVLAEIARAPDPRFREVMSAFVRHLHTFAREVKSGRFHPSRVGGTSKLLDF